MPGPSSASLSILRFRRIWALCCELAVKHCNPQGHPVQVTVRTAIVDSKSLDGLTFRNAHPSQSETLLRLCHRGDGALCQEAVMKKQVTVIGLLVVATVGIGGLANADAGQRGSGQTSSTDSGRGSSTRTSAPAPEPSAPAQTPNTRAPRTSAPLEFHAAPAPIPAPTSPLQTGTTSQPQPAVPATPGSGGSSGQ